jgi:hypothetical protein
MATNPWISQNVRSEQNLYEDLVIESLKFYGQDIYYLPREIVNQDKVFMDDVPSHFTDAYKIEMYVENTEGWGGEGDLFSKFGVELRDQATFVVARRRWKKLIGDKLDTYNFRPREGDLLYIPWSKSLFEIFKVETETPFYQLNQLPTFRLQCELFEYNDEDFDTDIAEIDDIELYNAYEYVLTMRTSEDGIATASAEINDLGQVTSINIEEGGFGYSDVPAIRIEENAGDNYKFGNSSLNCILGRGQEGSYTQTSTDGSTEFFIYVDTLPPTGHQQALFITGGNDGDNASNRYVWGIDSLGQLVYSRFDNNGGGVSTFTGGQIIFTTGQWYHIVIGAYDTDKLYIYVNGEELLNTTIAGANFDWISSAGYSIGSPSARTVDGVEWDGFRGYIDEFRAQVGDWNTIIDPRRSGIGVNLTIPTEAFTSEPADAALYHFDAENATATLTVGLDGRIESVVIDNTGIYYNNVPSITIDPPHTSLDYKRGEVVSQTTANYTIKGEVAKWSDSDKNLYLVHVGATDGQYHNFNTYNAVIGEETGASWSPTLVEEINNIQSSAQNVTVFDDFEGDLGNFLDFSESNPFGDMQ